MLEQEALGDIEQLGLRVVGAGDDAAGEELAGAARLRERVGEEATGGSFGHGEAFLLSAEQVGADLGERVVAAADDIVAEQGGALRRHGFDRRLVEGAIRRAEPQVDGALVRAERDAQARARAVEDWLKAGLQGGLADARGPQLDVSLAVAEEAARGESGDDLAEEHRLQLVGRAGEHHQHTAVLLHPEARGGAVGVGENLAPLEHLGLLEVVGRHLPPDAGEALLDGGLHRGVVHQPAAEHRGHGVAGAVVAGGPEAARGDHDVGPRPAFPELRRDRVGLVGEGDVALEERAAPAELGADEGEVAVRREAQEQFVAQREQFIAHRGHGAGGGGDGGRGGLHLAGRGP